MTSEVEQIRDWNSYDLSGLADGPLYFYVGAGLSISAGLVGWDEMACVIWRYLKSYEKAKAVGRCPGNVRDNARLLQSFVEETEGLTNRSYSLTRILSRESEDHRAFSRTVLLNMLLRYRAPGSGSAKGEGVQWEREPSEKDLSFQYLLWRSRCSGVLTSNYDMLLEHAYSLFNRGAALRSYHYTADFLRYILSNRRFVLKLHGDINDIASMQFDPHRAWERDGAFCGREKRGLDLKHVYNAILEQGHIVYVGCGFRDRTIEKLHGFWQSKSARSESRAKYCRIALLPKQNKVLDLDLACFKGIQFLTFPFGQWDHIGEFLESVVDTRSGASELKETCPEASDLYKQIFRSPSPTGPTRNFKTEPWTCRGVKH